MCAVLRLTVLAWGMAGAVATAAETQAVNAALPQDVLDAFAWYETLGYPKTGALQWIGVLPGEELRFEGEEQGRVPTRAFLLNDDDKRFTVLMPDLRQRTFKKEIVTLSISLSQEDYDSLKAAGKLPVLPQARVEWQKESFEKDARALLALGRQVAALANPPIRRDPFADPDRFAPPDPFGPPPRAPDPGITAIMGLEKSLGWLYHDGQGHALRSILFIFAHACHERNLTTLARELCAAVTLLPTAVGPDLLSKMQCDLGYLAIFRAVEAVGGTEFGPPWDPETARPLQTRKELLKRFRDFPGQYPASKHVAYAQEVSAMLETMVAEDEAHVSPTDTELERMTVEQQVHELIFRLRDQNGHQWAAPGECDVFDDYFHEKHPGLKRDSPADRLVAIGVPAVPQLIAALEDKHLTRTVACWRRYTFSHTILTVGDCIEAILQRISGRSFEVPQLPPPQEEAARHALIKAWWKEFRGQPEVSKGPK